MKSRPPLFARFHISFYRSMLAGFDDALFAKACVKLGQIGTAEAARAIIEAALSDRVFTTEQRTLLSGALVTIGESGLPVLHAAIRKNPHPVLIDALAMIAHPASADMITELLRSHPAPGLMHALGLAAPDRAIPLLEELLGDESYPLRLAVLDELEQRAPERLRSRCIRLLDDTSAAIRQRAAGILLAAESSIDPLVALKAHAIAGGAYAVTQPDTPLIEAINSLMASPHPDIRMNTLRIISASSFPGREPVLRRSLTDSDASLRLFALIVYGTLDEADPNAVIALLSDAELTVREEAERTIAGDPDRYLLPLCDTLRACVESGISVLYLTNIQNILIGWGAQALSHVEALLERGGSVAAAAAEIIAEINDPQVETIMLRLTASGNMTVRSIAVEALGGLKKPSLFETLAGLINDPSPPVRKSVYDSLVNTDLPRAEHLFRELATTGKTHDDDRTYLTNLLGEIGRLN